MTRDILITLAVAAGALVLFVSGRLRPDVVGVMVMTALIVTGILTPAEGISGFANEAVLTIAAMFVLSAGLVRAGAIEGLGRTVARLADGSELRLLAIAVALVIPLSAFLNNTPVILVIVPLVIGLSRDMGVRASRLLMPISFASQMGGTLTLIGTSTNLVVAGVVLELGLERIRLFDVTPAALVLTGLGVLYLLTVGRMLTPERKGGGDLLERYELRQYLTVLELDSGSRLAGCTLAETRFGERYGLEVLRIQREEEAVPRVGPQTTLRPGDLVLVRGSPGDIAAIDPAAGISIRGAGPDLQAVPERGRESPQQGGASLKLAELLVPPRSAVEGRTIEELRFRTRFGVPVLGVRRHGEALHGRLRDVALHAGDLILVQGTDEELGALDGSRDLTLLKVMNVPRRRRRKLRLALPILVGVVLLAAFDVMPILVSALLGVVAMFLTGCVTPEEAYEDVDWMVLVLLASILPLGLAMQKTGAAELLGQALVRVTEPLGLVGMVAAFYLLTSLLTELISNNATAVVLTPIAVATSSSLGVSHLPFVMAVMLAASNSFMTPIGYQTNMFVYGPGGYRFVDYLRVGGPLNLLMLVAATFVIPWFFPFQP